MCLRNALYDHTADLDRSFRLTDLTGHFYSTERRVQLISPCTGSPRGDTLGTQYSNACLPQRGHHYVLQRETCVGNHGLACLCEVVRFVMYRCAMPVCLCLATDWQYTISQGAGSPVGKLLKAWYCKNNTQCIWDIFSGHASIFSYFSIKHFIEVHGIPCNVHGMEWKADGIL